MPRKSLKTETFKKTSEALKFIDELAKKNKRCYGKLTCSPTKDPAVYDWHVTYEPLLLEKEVVSKEASTKVIEAKISKVKVKVKVKSKLKPARAKR